MVKNTPRKIIYKAGWKLGPRGCVLFLAGLLWLVEGFGVLAHLDGWVMDAPHIRYGPNHFRAGMWFATGALALLTCRNRDKGKLGAAALLVMPGVRCMSYGLAWISSWPIVDPLIPDEYLPGDPRAWYYLARNSAYLLIAICATRAPISWPVSAREDVNANGVARNDS